ncbi:MAG TPA: RidA family protein [Polyangiaceae bacterium]|jgi:2-iminobutanoate/2-iminopropanoate deaminase|nr:MAG: Enamine/imine deaminase [Deltaproteobacteria bacterium ADurb.Bin207]HNS99167.1 RidA family protein [Polyangiaceae bacterium]HNZ24129.1 RidA family protein [Polyangiaceae bacterium]HOD23794.1 RidA family protein [Polyangiaceae bacterium]HOE48779.1 RidA family protein [Polyangiaceae bacterium]
MTRAIIRTEQAPAAIGPYSQAVRAGDFVFCSGQIPLDPVSGQVVEGDIRVQTEQVMNNLRAVLEAAGGGLDKIVKSTIFLVDLGDFGAVNETYARYFQGDAPARACVEVSKLPRGVRVEIEATAYLGA